MLSVSASTVTLSYLSATSLKPSLLSWAMLELISPSTVTTFASYPPSSANLATYSALTRPRDFWSVCMEQNISTFVSAMIPVSSRIMGIFASFTFLSAGTMAAWSMGLMTSASGLSTRASSTICACFDASFSGL